jgi:hypothetical protein
VGALQQLRLERGLMEGGEPRLAGNTRRAGHVHQHPAARIAEIHFGVGDHAGRHGVQQPDLREAAERFIVKGNRSGQGAEAFVALKQNASMTCEAHQVGHEQADRPRTNNSNVALARQRHGRHPP